MSVFVDDARSVTIRNSKILGSFSGDPIPVICENCGPIIIPGPTSRSGTLSFLDTEIRCQKCKGVIELRSAHYDFEKRVFEILQKSQISRKQARQFERKIEKTKDLSALEIHSATINPALADVVKLAREQKDPFAALKVARDIVLFLFACAGGVVAADTLWDKYHSGELFEQYQSQPPNDVQEDTDAESGNETGTRDFDRTGKDGWQGIDV